MIAPDVADSCRKEGSKVGIRSAPVGEIKPLKENIFVKISPLKVSKEGVITDPRSTLEWVPDPGNLMNWTEANQFVQSLSLAGGGWRLPTIQELKTLYDKSCDNNIVHPSFNLGRGGFAWSSQLDEPYFALTFDFNNGNADRDSRNNPYRRYGRVLAVQSQT